MLVYQEPFFQRMVNYFSCFPDKREFKGFSIFGTGTASIKVGEINYDVFFDTALWKVRKPEEGVLEEGLEEWNIGVLPVEARVKSLLRIEHPLETVRKSLEQCLKRKTLVDVEVLYEYNIRSLEEVQGHGKVLTFTDHFCKGVQQFIYQNAQQREGAKTL